MTPNMINNILYWLLGMDSKPPVLKSATIDGDVGPACIEYENERGSKLVIFVLEARLKKPVQEMCRKNAEINDD